MGKTLKTKLQIVIVLFLFFCTLSACLKVTIVPMYQGVEGNYYFTFTPEKFHSGMRMELKFPPGTTICPPLSNDESQNAVRFQELAKSIECYNHSAYIVFSSPEQVKIEFLSDSSLLLTFVVRPYFQPSIKEGEELTILVRKSARIVAPKNSKECRYQIKTEHDSEWTTSKTMTFKPNAHEERAQLLEVDIDPPVTSSSAEYRFIFYPQENYPDTQWINIRFPKGTFFDPPLSSDRILDISKAIGAFAHNVPTCCMHFQGLPVFHFNDDGTIDMRLILGFPIEVQNEKWDHLMLRISRDAGIHTPAKAGKHAYMLQTEAEPEWRASKVLLKNLAITIPKEEIEAVLDLLESSGIVDRCPIGVEILFNRPFLDTDEINLMMVDTCGTFYYPQSIIYDLNNKTHSHSALMKNDNVGTISHFSMFMWHGQVTWKTGLHSYLFALPWGFSTLNPDTCLIHKGGIPFYCESMYLSSDRVFLGDRGHDLYSIPYPSLDVSSLKKVYSLSDKNLVISGILHYDASKEVLYVSAREKIDSSLPEATYQSGIIMIDLVNKKEEFVFSFNNSYSKDEKKGFGYAKLQEWTHNFAYQGDYWLITEIQKEDDQADENHLFHVYDLEKNHLGAYLPYEGYQAQSDLILKTHPDGTYLYWVDDFVLYRWKTPLE